MRLLRSSEALSRAAAAALTAAKISRGDPQRSKSCDKSDASKTNQQVMQESPRKKRVRKKRKKSKVEKAIKEKERSINGKGNRNASSELSTGNTTSNTSNNDTDGEIIQRENNVQPAYMSSSQT